MNQGNPAAPPEPPGLAELRQPGLAALVRLAEQTAQTSPIPVIALDAPHRAGALQPGARHRRPRHPRHLWLVLVPILAALAAVAGLLAIGGPGAQPAGAAACRHIAGPFRSSHAAIYGAGGRRYIPYGINLTGSDAAMLAEEDAAVSSWCVNTIRLGVDQHSLINGGQVNHAYLSTTAAVAAHATRLGLDVVLVLGGYGSGRPLPTHSSLVAWEALARHFKAVPGAIFDLWNEPAGPWPVWRNGGFYNGRWRVGMETLARGIRAQRARNLIWVEGRARGSKFDGIPRYALRNVGPVEYAEHRPPDPQTPGSWRTWWAHVAVRYPLVIGEWANYSRAGTPWACWDNAPVLVPRFLRYLAARHIGLIGYDLAAPRLLESSSLADPNHIRANWRCADGLNEGAGHQVMRWFARRNG